MTIASSVGDVDASLGAVADDLARASLALARRFQAGGTMWCASPKWPFHAHHVAVEFVHPVIVGKRALAAVTVPAGADLVATLRASVRPGDIVVALADADDAALADATRRGAFPCTTPDRPSPTSPPRRRRPREPRDHRLPLPLHRGRRVRRRLALGRPRSLGSGQVGPEHHPAGGDARALRRAAAHGGRR